MPINHELIHGMPEEVKSQQEQKTLQNGLAPSESYSALRSELERATRLVNKRTDKGKLPVAPGLTITVETDLSELDSVKSY